MMNSDKTPPNIPDYDDLAFKPAMIWEELCEYAKSLDIDVFIGSDYFNLYGLNFNEEGNITFELGDDDIYFIATNRTYEQMKNIIDNLYGE